MAQPPQGFRPGSPATLVAGLLLVGLLVAGLSLSGSAGGRTLAYALFIGTAAGITMQRTRFCFFCHLRDLFEGRDGRGALAILLALAVGTVGMQLVYQAWLPVPTPERLPADAHIGPVSWALVLGGLAFGLGMVISGSCIGAHWYRLGEGAAISPFALIGTVIGFALGFNSWEPLFLATIATAPVVWLPRHLGYAGSIGLQLAALALLAIAVWRFGPRPSPAPAAAPPRTFRELGQRLFSPQRWPAWLGGILIGWLAMLILLRLRPLGVTSALGGAARDYGSQLGLVPAQLPGLDALGGCATATAVAWWQTPNAVLIAGLVVASTAMALLSGQFRPRRPDLRTVLRGLGGGVLLGWGAMTALGCTIGTLLSGIMAGALSGWVFGLSMLAMVWLGVRLRWAP